MTGEGTPRNSETPSPAGFRTCRVTPLRRKKDSNEAVPPGLEHIALVDDDRLADDGDAATTLSRRGPWR
jgi:hypothetical protein